jgi:predicted transcriptional regulator
MPNDRAHLDTLVAFFKALADENRLKIVGLLAHQPRTADELAALLDLAPPTVSHHLQKLREAGLVDARPQQYYNVYALRAEALHDMAQQVLSADALKESTQSVDLDAYSNKVLSDFFIRGKLKTIPASLKKREVIIRRLAQEFEIGKRYPEKRVNEILRAFHADFATLRRELVDMKFLARENGYYWRVA